MTSLLLRQLDAPLSLYIPFDERLLEFVWVKLACWMQYKIKYTLQTTVMYTDNGI